MSDKFSPELQAKLIEMAGKRGIDPNAFLGSLLDDATRASEGPRMDYSGSYPKPKVVNKLADISGKFLHGDSRGMLHEYLKPESVDLIVTSPPFALTRKKAYGNESAANYCDWFRPWAAGMWRVLKPNGSVIIDIGGAYKPGLPTREIYQFELLRMLVREYKFELCLEHYWFSPSKMPSPVEWVNVRRIRPKDSVNLVLWLSKTAWPKASNTRTLTPYSRSMRDLLNRKISTGTGYWSENRKHTRPSAHAISSVWNRANQGSISPNLLAIPNTSAMKQYIQYCRDNGHKVHPARYPETLPEYFIRMLSDPGDLVVDPFGGSCTTGQVAERMGRKWICCELDRSYLDGAVGRFINKQTESISKDSQKSSQQSLLTDEFSGETELPGLRRARHRLEKLEDVQARLKDPEETVLCTSCDKSVGKVVQSALKTAITQIKTDLKTPDFRWRTDSVQIAPPCALPADESQSLDPHGGQKEREEIE